MPTVLSAVAFWWIFDTQFSIFTWLLQKAGFLAKGQ
ncbi:MAG: ABC transporter permease, partial [Methylobacterium sp.]|nr:ABC transporter permease [Methylobacterium sp.]